MSEGKSHSRSTEPDQALYSGGAGQAEAHVHGRRHDGRAHALWRAAVWSLAGRGPCRTGVHMMMMGGLAMPPFGGGPFPGQLPPSSPCHSRSRCQGHGQMLNGCDLAALQALLETSDLLYSPSMP